MCYSKQRVREAAAARSVKQKMANVMQQEQQQQQQQQGSRKVRQTLPKQTFVLKLILLSFKSSFNDADDSVVTSNNNKVRCSRLKQVHLHKNDSEELGMAILGGSEHGLPLMISEVREVRLEG